jgi:hypothetical protein
MQKHSINHLTLWAASGANSATYNGAIIAGRSQQCTLLLFCNNQIPDFFVGSLGNYILGYQFVLSLERSAF